MTVTERESVERLLAALERMGQEGNLLPADWRRVLLRNLLIGVARGLGFTLGFSVLGALLALLLRSLVVDNIPLIGGFLAEVIHAIEARM